MKKNGYEALLDRHSPKPGALARAAQLNDAARNLETLEELAREQAEARADGAGASAVTPAPPVPASASASTTHVRGGETSCSDPTKSS